MKIVFLAPFGIRPKGTVHARMIPLAAGLQRLGHEVVIIAPPYTNPEDAGRTELVQGVRVRNVRLGPGGSALSALPLAWRMLRAALEEKPALIHLFKPKGYAGLAAMALIGCRRVGIAAAPVFLDTDDWEGKGGMNDLLPYSRAEKWFFAFQEGWLIKRSHAVSVASRGLEKLVRGMGIAGESVCYLPNCVDDLPPGRGARVRERFGIREDAPVLILYTRFFEFEQERLHAIFAAIHKAVPPVRFLVVGQGRQGEEELLRRSADANGYGGALIMAGWTEPEQLPDMLAAADLAIYPFSDNLINRTKCPAKLTELLRAGIAVVADDVGQIPEFLAPELRELLCHPDDAARMAEHCIKLLRDPDKCRLLGNAGRAYILEHFSWSDAACVLDRFYESSRITSEQL